MKRHFVKMHGCGNDYIYFDCMTQPMPDPEAVSRRLSDRHKGIGGDGVVLICPDDTADARMRMFNADGSEGAMCGNAIRCVGKYMYESGIARKNTVTVATKSGIKTLELTVENGTVVGAMVAMGPARFEAAAVPVTLPGDRVVGGTLTVEGKPYTVTCLSMGNPHCVVFCDDPEQVDVWGIGPSFEHHPAFPDRVNTEFVRVLDDHTLSLRVWERGSGETLACGTGTCAAVAAAVENGYCPLNEPVCVHLRGGDLTVRVTPDNVYLSGPMAVAFEGDVEL